MSHLIAFVLDLQIIHVEHAKYYVKDLGGKVSATYDEVQKQTNSALVLHNFLITLLISLHDALCKCLNFLCLL